MRVGVTGHQALSAEALDHARSMIAGSLRRESALVGVTCLAVGADQEFAEIVRDEGGRLVIVVPCDGYEATFETATALARYRALKFAADEIVELGFDSPSEAAFFAAGRRVVDESDRILAIWDGHPARGLGGTADVVAYARRRGVPVTIVWPPGPHDPRSPDA